MNKKIVGILVCMLFLFSAVPIIQGAYNKEAMDYKSDNLQIRIVRGGNDFSDTLQGFNIIVTNMHRPQILVHINLTINSYDINGKLIDTQSKNVTGWIGQVIVDYTCFEYFYLLQNNSLISFVKVDVKANEKTLSKTGLFIGQYFLFFIRNFS